MRPEFGDDFRQRFGGAVMAAVRLPAELPFAAALGDRGARAEGVRFDEQQAGDEQAGVQIGLRSVRLPAALAAGCRLGLAQGGGARHLHRSTISTAGGAAPANSTTLRLCRSAPMR